MADVSLSELIYPELRTTERLNITGKSTNFHIWKTKMEFVLVDKKVNYVLTQPVPDKVKNPVAHQKFLADDLTARRLILGCLHDHLRGSYNRHESAKSLFDALKSSFLKPSMTKRMNALHQYVTHKMSEDTPVDKHVLKMSALAMELEIEGVKVPENLQAVVLMCSLPDSWEDVIPMMIMNIDENGLGLQEVVKRVRGAGALKELQRSSFRNQCSCCGEFGHHEADCPSDDEDFL